jgi:hypothetical protein
MTIFGAGGFILLCGVGILKAIVLIPNYIFPQLLSGYRQFYSALILFIIGLILFGLGIIYDYKYSQIREKALKMAKESHNLEEEIKISQEKKQIATQILFILFLFNIGFVVIWI